MYNRNSKSGDLTLELIARATSGEKIIVVARTYEYARNLFDYTKLKSPAKYIQRVLRTSKHIDFVGGGSVSFHSIDSIEDRLRGKTNYTLDFVNVDYDDLPQNKREIVQYLEVFVDRYFDNKNTNWWNI